MYKKGFTLIELLVVIAIIGILAAIVLGSLNQGRKKGNDAKIKSELANIRSAANVYQDEPDKGSYAGLCAVTSTDTSGLYLLLQDSSYPAGVHLDCGASADQYSVAAPLQGVPGHLAWCVDDRNTSRDTMEDGVTPYDSVTGGTYPAHSSAGATQCN